MGSKLSFNEISSFVRNRVGFSHLYLLAPRILAVHEKGYHVFRVT